jgi:hypothetical protein
MAQLIIDMRKLLGWEHAHANLPLTQRATVSVHFLVEQKSEFIHALDGRRNGGLDDSRLIQLLDRLHIGGKFNFHGQARTGRVFPCVARPDQAVPSIDDCTAILKRLAQAFNGLCKALHKIASI